MTTIFFVRHQRTIFIGNDPFLEVEAHSADASFYKLKSDQEKEKGVAKAKDSLRAPHSPPCRVHQTVTQLDCRAVKTYRRFKVPKGRKSKKPLIIHALVNMGSHGVTQKDYEPNNRP